MDNTQFLLKTVLDQVNDGVYYVDLERKITYWNRASERITGYTGEQMVGQFCQSNLLMHVNNAGETLCLGACPLAKTLKDGEPREAQLFLHHRDGHRVPVAVRVTPIIEDGRITGAVEIFTENVSLAMALARIEHLQREVNLDPLTGISSRRMTQALMERSGIEWSERSIPYGLLLADIDHFKDINDTHGHDVGDRVLRMVAQSLSNGLRESDFVGRWGGEEFLAVINRVDIVELSGVAERLRMLVENSLFFLDESDRNLKNAVRATVSIGGTLAKPGETPEQMLVRADRCMYLSKTNGRNRVTLE